MGEQVEEEKTWKEKLNFILCFIAKVVTDEKYRDDACKFTRYLNDLIPPNVREKR